ncbi:PIG-L family deacetylase [Brasilonema sp. UFV-L1]|uniref:PIG-L deacetylase family protein n=1 Tax=Brasilonema sp. UFV-L1 TaxID=2234130 RepID=UPI00145E887B|nr:PIG-L family deacetylase [Brasilonema sp. UFV-L1]NMG06933.1 PIG-L family deacetylase [Brasilonema sp. UFV-L1]
MSKIPLLGKLKYRVEYKVRDINSRVCNWVLRVKSKPLTVSEKPIMVFSPHQDDETIGCGGMIALKRSQGIPVTVIFLTDGRYGRPEWVKPEEIIQVRQQEAISALKNLGIEKSAIHFLDHTDGSLAKLEGEQRQQLIAHLVGLLKSFQPGEIYVPHSKDGHPDHEGTYELVQKAIAESKILSELLQYPIWIFWYNLLPFKFSFQHLTHTYRLCISSVHQQKKQAISQYKSQLPDLPKGLLTSFFSPYEIFIKN